MKNSRTKSSILNAIVMITNTAVLSILALVSTNLILKNYGSDFNGVVATANQFVNLLLIIEGGFTTAINVALFKPYVKNDTKKINAIMSAAKKTFLKIGLIFLIVGIIVSLVYPLFIKSNLDYFTIFLIFVMVMIGTAYNLMFLMKSQIMFQVSQREYVYTFFGIIINTLSSLLTIILAYNKVNMLIIRFFILFFVIVNGIVLYILYKKHFGSINTDVKPDYKSIKGTKDIMIQKFTSVVYLSAPLLFISTFISTKMSSVYAVYSSIYNIIKNFLSSMIAAPVNGFGQLLSEGKKESVYKKFQLYEYIVILVAAILISSALSVIIPFIKLYTATIKDINYANFVIATMLAIIVFLEVIHIPSGNIINVTGNFKVARKIQTVASVLLVVLLFIGGLFFEIYGILIATIITNLVLAYLEIHYVHTKIFLSNIKNFLYEMFVNVLLVIVLVFIVQMIGININSYFGFILAGVLVLISNSIIILLVNYILFNDRCKTLINTLTGLFKRKKHS